MIPSDQLLLLLPAITVMAALYSSVGHGGASGYLVAMVLLGVAPETMKPAALIMNIFVTGLACFRLGLAGHLRPRLILPLVATSIPAAFLGGMIKLDSAQYSLILGGALLASALKILLLPAATEQPLRQASVWLLLLTGALIGLIAGLTGIGGGVYLSPILLLAGWTTMRTNAATASVFILCNSLAGLAGHYTTGAALPAEIGWLVLAAVIGALIGTELCKRLPLYKLSWLLGIVLMVAALKLLSEAVPG
ncbi:MAG: sulfite exporter TauE/SafE family protein [Gammaproteobacteria bacterium]|nr:sulfite exporter TauE/SafE family protein [Gammaproteobacteria bacterium]